MVHLLCVVAVKACRHKSGRNPHKLYIHCNEHCLNLCLVESIYGKTEGAQASKTATIIAEVVRHNMGLKA